LNSYKASVNKKFNLTIKQTDTRVSIYNSPLHLVTKHEDVRSIILKRPINFKTTKVLSEQLEDGIKPNTFREFLLKQKKEKSPEALSEKNEVKGVRAKPNI
jgi:hypothetical protein